MTNGINFDFHKCKIKQDTFRTGQILLVISGFPELHLFGRHTKNYYFYLKMFMVGSGEV
jgi:hypothetical protein